MKPNYIDGRWVEAARSRPDINPSDIADVVGEYAQADVAQTDEAIAAAERAFPGWAHTGVQARADALELRAARAGPPRGRVLLHRQDRVHRGMSSGS